MSILKDKHVVIAMAMAPVLALIAYFGVSALIGEDSLPAQSGQSYKLVEKPNCRYASGQCGLKNGDFELTLDFEQLGGGRLLLSLASVHPLDGVLLAVVESEDDETPPVAMRATSADGMGWSLEVVAANPETQRMRLVATSNQAYYFGDAALKFTLPADSE